MHPNVCLFYYNSLESFLYFNFYTVIEHRNELNVIELKTSNKARSMEKGGRVNLQVFLHNDKQV